MADPSRFGGAAVTFVTFSRPCGTDSSDELVPGPIMWESGWGSRAAEFATFSRSFGVWVITEAKGAAPTALAIIIH
jgi:hypothetical protein